MPGGIILARLRGAYVVLQRPALRVPFRIDLASSDARGWTHVDRVTVFSPATTANMGPGFDCIGMAFEMWNELTVERGDFHVTIEGEGEGAAELPEDSRNLVVTGVEAAFRAVEKELPPLRYTCKNEVPHGRGLGSSSAAIAAGLIAGSALADAKLSIEQIVSLAADLEGHPDNVAPAIYGGCTIGVHDGGQWIINSVPVPDDLSAVVFIPDLLTNTHESRARLPERIPRSDAVYNIGRAALLVSAMHNSRFDLLKQATQDRLHQPLRGQAFPALNRLIEAALSGGAHGAFLSGAGPTVMALTTGKEVTVSYEMAEAARLSQVPGKPAILKPAMRGTYVAETA